MESHNERLLKSIYQNCRLGMHGIDTIIADITHPHFLEEVNHQNETYTLIAKECEMIAKAENIKLQDISLMDKSMMFITEKMKTMFNKTCRKHALMMFLGTNMGIPDLIIALCDFVDADNETILLAKKLLKLEEEYVEKLKKFLCCNRE